MSYNIGDFAIQLKNAAMAKRKQVSTQYSNIRHAIAQLLKQKGFLSQVKEEAVDGKRMLTVRLHYEQRSPVITDVNIISKPSLRVYVDAKDIEKKYRRGLGITVVSTNEGVMTSSEASKKGVGGEILFRIW